MNKLSERVEKYKIPPIPYLPSGKTILVWRLESEEKNGLIYVPEEHREVKDIGILLAAGLTARDVFADHLIEIGDICWFGRFAGTERTVKRAEGEKGQKILSMKVEDVLGSVDALERVKDYAIVRDDKPGDPGATREHFYVKKGGR